MAAAFENFMAQGYDSQQMTSMHFGASSESHNIPFGYSNRTEASGEAYWAQPVQHTAPREDTGFHWPQQQYNYPDHYAPNYMQYAQQSFPAFQEPPAMPDVYPNFHQQHHSAPAQGPYHAPYQQQFAYTGVPRFQGQYPMFPGPMTGPQQHHSTFPPMMMDSAQSSPYSAGWRANHEPGSHQRGAGRTSGTQKCDFPGCGRVYTTIALLKAHMKVHLNDEVHHCNWGGCGQKFVGSDELSCHISQHIGPYYRRHFSFSPP